MRLKSDKIENDLNIIKRAIISNNITMFEIKILRSLYFDRFESVLEKLKIIV